MSTPPHTALPPSANQHTAIHTLSVVDSPSVRTHTAAVRQRTQVEHGRRIASQHVELAAQPLRPWRQTRRRRCGPRRQSRPSHAAAEALLRTRHRRVHTRVRPVIRPSHRVLAEPVRPLTAEPHAARCRPVHRQPHLTVARGRPRPLAGLVPSAHQLVAAGHTLYNAQARVLALYHTVLALA